MVVRASPLETLMTALADIENDPNIEENNILFSERKSVIFSNAFNIAHLLFNQNDNFGDYY